MHPFLYRQVLLNDKKPGGNVSDYVEERQEMKMCQYDRESKNGGRIYQSRGDS